MRLLYLAGVAILAFIAGDATGAKVLVPDDSDHNRAQAASASVVSTTRLLRTRSVIDEERAGGISASASDKLAKLFKSTKVTDEQLQQWLNKGKTAESVFYRMNLENTLYTRVFKSPQFPRWLQYADDLSASGKGSSAISILSTKYGDEKLYQMIGWAKKESSTKVLGTRLQTEQLEHWVKVGKDPEEVFKLYDLNYAGRRILSNSQFSAWMKYVDDLNAKNEGAFVSIIPTLRKYFSDDDLFKIALAAKRSGETEAMGTKLDDAFVQFWIHRKETPDNVLVELGLKKSMETLLENPLLNILTKYTETYNVNYAVKKTTVVETLTRTFDDETVARMLLAGREKSTTKKIAKQFQADQLEMWVNSGQSVDDVYKLLNLPSRRDLLVDFGNQKLFDTWLTFMNAVSVKTPEKTSAIFSKLATSFEDRPMMQILEAANKFSSMEKAATKLQLEKAQSIFSTGVSPRKAFKMVALDNVGDSVLSSPLLKKWMLYVEDFNKKNPGKEESWFLPLRVNYQNLGRTIDKAMKDPSTVKLAQLVQKENMKEWLERWKYSPNMAFRELHLNKAGEKVFSAPNFELWVKYLDDWNQAYPSKKETMIDGFRGNYHDLDLVPMLAAAEKAPSTKKLASELKDALVDKWVAEKKTLAYVKSWLKGISSSDDMLERFTAKLNSV
uniref:RxLR128 n=1 Tax=Phytophthora capsici TaxID=4784 RepID=A0A140CZC5_PHYCP|nr:RxLR128 [Phytophthora capsici]